MLLLEAFLASSSLEGSLCSTALGLPSISTASPVTLCLPLRKALMMHQAQQRSPSLDSQLQGPLCHVRSPVSTDSGGYDMDIFGSHY